MKHPNAPLHNPPGLVPEQTFETLRGEIFSPRWGHSNSYSLTRTDKGWITKNRGPIDNQAADDGSPAWYGELSNDGITWTGNTPGFIERLWEGLTNGELTPEQAEEAFTRYCGFLSRVNRLYQHPFENSPQTWDKEDWARLKAEYPDAR